MLSAEFRSCTLSRLGHLEEALGMCRIKVLQILYGYVAHATNSKLVSPDETNSYNIYIIINLS